MKISIDDIDFNKLLNRDNINVENDENINTYHYLANKTILISGGYGSIGSEIIRQLLILGINNLLIYDNSEIGYFNLENEINEKFTNHNVKFYLGDINDGRNLENIFNVNHPHIIFHCAAYKHVSIVEKNPNEGIKINIIGTKNIADLSIKYNVDKFIMISTDKAVNPTNIMGVTKRIAELYINSLNKYNKTEFITTRFGNVLGSSGSVIPTFIKRINVGLNLQITHPDIIRYFMTIPEAAQLVLQASAMGNRGEILLFDMGKPYKIVDLAEKMILFYSEKNIDIEFTYLRPGEKLYEELLCDGENILPTSNKKIMKLKHNCDIDYDLYFIIFNKIINNYFTDIDELKNLFKIIIPEYNMV